MSYPFNSKSKNDTQLINMITEEWRGKGVPEETIQRWLGKNIEHQKELAKPKNRLKRILIKLQQFCNDCGAAIRS